MSTDGTTFLYPGRTSTMSYRVPTPPRIVVPPPALNSKFLPDITLNASENANLLAQISCNNIVTQNALLEWTYEQRRDAQRVLPYLFLGPMTAAKDEAFLQREKITCLLGVRQKGAFEGKLMNGALKKAQNAGLECHIVDLGSNQDLIRAFQETTAMIYTHAATQLKNTGQIGNVLVFCESGNERSAGVVAAYLMEMFQDVDHIKAIQLCQAQRFCVNFDDGMKRLLQGYWDILCARRAVAAQDSDRDANAQNSGSERKAKRGLERDEDEEMAGMDDDDMERFQGRDSAPFSDQML